VEPNEEHSPARWSGLAPIIAQDLKRIIQDLALQSGMAIMLVEQHVRVALSLTRKAIVLERGQIAHRADSSKLAQDLDVLHRLVAVA